MSKVFENVSAVGVDGYKKGWCCCFQVNEKMKVIVIEKIDQLPFIFPTAKHILIDIPIGLGTKNRLRDLDQFARQHLKPGKTSSIFTAPVRGALIADNYHQACDLNFQISGKKISIQSWNISKKILEVDTYLQCNISMKQMLHEAHPEICFKYLNDGKLLSFGKHDKNKRGIKERLTVLSKYHQKVHDSFEYAVSTHQKKGLKADDIADAMCLCVVGQLGAQYGFDKIIGKTEQDEKGIDMKLYYYDDRRSKTAN